MTIRVGSPRPKVQPFVTQGTPQQVETKALAKINAALTSSVSAKDVDAFLHARTSGPKERGLLPSLAALLEPANSAVKQRVRAEANDVQDKLSTAVAQLGEVYRDGLITEPEMSVLKSAKQRLDAVAALFDPAVLNMLPRDTRERLQNDLIGPVNELRTAAERRHGRMVDGVVKNLQWVQANPTPEYGFVDVRSLAHSGGTINGVDRYAPGDMVSVPRSDGSFTLGVVQSVHAGAEGAEGKLTCEFLTQHGQLATKELTNSAVIAANPLKIGDCVDTADGRMWVTGTNAHGLNGVLEGASGRRNVDTQWMAGLAHNMEQMAAQMRAQHAAASRPTVISPAAQDASPRVDTKVLIAAGGYESTKPDEVRGQTANGALFTWRGIGYADYNEDGAVLGVIAKGQGVPHETVLAGAFDQAGGMGHAKQTGAASQIAAQCFDAAAKKIAQGGAAEQLLKGAVAEAHAQVNALGVGAATTFAAAVVQNGVAHVVNCGDSAVMIFDKNGKLKGATEAHNLGDIMAKQTGDPNAGLNVANVITSCIGGNEAPQADYSKLNVVKGDVIVCVSDGVADANLSAQKRDFQAGKPWTELNGEKTTRDIGDIVRARTSGGPAAITQAIIDYARAQVENGSGKKDNVTATVLTIS